MARNAVSEHPQRRMKPLGKRGLLLAAAVAGVYIGAAKLGLDLSVARGVITPVWAPTGISLAALVLVGPRLWPAVAIGALVANATSGTSLLLAAAISVGNTLEAVAGAGLLRRVGFRPALDRVRDVLALVLLGAAASTTISATNGVTALWVAGHVSGSSYGSEWFLWWSGDAMGDVVVAPLLFVWAAAPLRNIARLRALEAGVLLALLAGVSAFVFLGGYWRYPHLLFPLLIWAALRFQQRGAVTSSFAVAAIAVAGAVHGTTPLGGGSATEIVQILEGLLATLIISLLILGAVLAERAAAEAGLEQAHAALAEAQTVAHIGSWEWSVATNRVLWSEELYRIYDLDPASEVTYESYLARIHPEDRRLVEQGVERARTDRRPFAFDHRIVLRSGQIRWVYGRGRVVVDNAGEVVRMVGTSQDITERKRLDELRDTILATVSHELRTPLTSIVGFALTLQKRGANLAQETRRALVQQLVEQALRLERLLSDLLDLDRLRHGATRPRFRETDIGRLVSEVAAAHPSDGRPIEVRTQSILAEVDAPKVERIVENLLANALKHTPPDSTVSVRVEDGYDGVLIAVDDCGPGIDPTEREAIFELFNRGESSPEVTGAGIGLSLVAQFTAVHDGRVWVEDAPGGGASFRVLLPTRRGT